MSKAMYHTPLEQAIRECTLAELVTFLSHTHPAFLSAVVKAKKALERQ